MKRYKYKIVDINEEYAKFFWLDSNECIQHKNSTKIEALSVW